MEPFLFIYFFKRKLHGSGLRIWRELEHLNFLKKIQKQYTFFASKLTILLYGVRIQRAWTNMNKFLTKEAKQKQKKKILEELKVEELNQI